MKRKKAKREKRGRIYKMALMPVMRDFRTIATELAEKIFVSKLYSHRANTNEPYERCAISGVDIPRFSMPVADYPPLEVTDTYCAIESSIDVTTDPEVQRLLADLRTFLELQKSGDLYFPDLTVIYLIKFGGPYIAKFNGRWWILVQTRIYTFYKAGYFDANLDRPETLTLHDYYPTCTTYYRQNYDYLNAIARLFNEYK